jgi:hypothetical protein
VGLTFSIEQRADAWVGLADHLEAVVTPKLGYAIRQASHFAVENLTTPERAGWWLRERVQTIMKVHLKSALQQFALIEQRSEEKRLIDAVAREQADWIAKNAFATATWLSEDEQKRYAEVIAHGHGAGLSLSVISAQLVAGGLKVSRAKAFSIARNETMKAGDLAQEEVLRLLGRVPRAKAWVDRHDTVVRDAHSSIAALPKLDEGEFPTTTFAGSFNCGGVVCSGPRDAALRAADPALWINCRCYRAYID